MKSQCGNIFSGSRKYLVHCRKEANRSIRTMFSTHDYRLGNLSAVDTNRILFDTHFVEACSILWLWVLLLEVLMCVCM